MAVATTVMLLVGTFAAYEIVTQPDEVNRRSLELARIVAVHVEETVLGSRQRLATIAETVRGSPVIDSTRPVPG